MKRVCGLMLFCFGAGMAILLFIPATIMTILFIIEDRQHQQTGVRLVETRQVNLVGIQLILLVESVCWKRERCADTRFQLK